MSTLRVLSLLPALSLVVLVACGDDDDDGDSTPSVDAAPQPDVSEGSADAAPVDAALDAAPDATPGAVDAAPEVADAAPDPADAGPDAAPLICSVSSPDFGDVGAAASTGFIDLNNPGAEDDVVWSITPLEAGSPSDSLEVELYASYGVFAAGLAPGTYTIAGEDTNYATCGLCVMIKTNLAPGSFEDVYLATGGTVTITQLGNTSGGQLALTLSNITLGHVNIDPETAESTPASACTTAVDAASISATLQ